MQGDRIITGGFLRKLLDSFYGPSSSPIIFHSLAIVLNINTLLSDDDDYDDYDDFDDNDGYDWK